MGSIPTYPKDLHTALQIRLKNLMKPLLTIFYTNRILMAKSLAIYSFVVRYHIGQNRDDPGWRACFLPRIQNGVNPQSFIFLQEINITSSTPLLIGAKPLMYLDLPSSWYSNNALPHFSVNTKACPFSNGVPPLSSLYHLFLISSSQRRSLFLLHVPPPPFSFSF
ncbi:hypothetical protein VNO77_41445 [Canavalia gladiata]|uniref:Uncharacterized protein n=1 Tax=Canavalia gladiata TaxID=3824 RepID=A0AAN9K003_CANGL